MLKLETLVLLQNGDVRPGRVYDGEFKASGCGRLLEGKEGKVIVAPGGTILTTSDGIRKSARDMGWRAYKVDSLERETVQRALEVASTLAEKRALRWLLGV